MAFLTDFARWRALSVRDPAANGQFVYSVKTTSIYCRPTCPGRLARRANVGFYDTAKEAEADGFRPCKRCKPEAATCEDSQDMAVVKACDLMERALSQKDPKSFKLQDLARCVGLTPRYFHKIFKDKMGMTPKEYAKLRSEMNHDEKKASAMNFDVLGNMDTVDLDTFDFGGILAYGLNVDGLSCELLDCKMDGAVKQGTCLQQLHSDIVPLTLASCGDSTLEEDLFDEYLCWSDANTPPGAVNYTPVIGNLGHNLPLETSILPEQNLT